MDRFEMHLEGRINKPEEQLNKENKEQGQQKIASNLKPKRCTVSLIDKGRFQRRIAFVEELRVEA